jgi:WXG100 family type VII secretion target
MAEDAYSLDTDGLQATIDELIHCYATLRDVATQLERRVRELHLAWDGQAADAHRLAKSSWDRGFAEMREALERMRRAGAAAHRNYTSAAATNHEMWGQVR